MIMVPIYCSWTSSKYITTNNILLTLSTLCIGTGYSTCFVCLFVCLLPISVK